MHFFLKSKGWATSLSAGVGDEGMHRSSIAYIFVMSIYLTESGLENVCTSFSSQKLCLLVFHPEVKLGFSVYFICLVLIAIMLCGIYILQQRIFIIALGLESE